MEFYLGSDVAGLQWGVPVMVSHGRLRTRKKKLRRATAPWVCDSRGFTELSQYGKWTIGPAEYADALRRYAEEAGSLRWASPQDWMCEPFITAKTGKTVDWHQQKTVESVATMRSLVSGVDVIPVVQGYTIDEYLDCIALYQRSGFDLWQEPVVGLGSVCRRQATKEIHTIISTLAGLGLRLHGFGVKTAAVKAVGTLLESADSEAWSMTARRDIVHCGHGLAVWAQNCRMCALVWRDAVLAGLGPTTVLCQTIRTEQRSIA